MRDKLQEVILEYGRRMREYMRSGVEAEGIGYPMSWDDEATQAILDLLDKSVASVELADTYDIEGGEDPYDAYEMGFDRGLADVRKVIKEEL